MDDIARLSPQDRADLFQTAAGQRGDLRAELIEKDFWVCWTLKRLFTLEHSPAGMIFKGGTSLSKVYQAISRFSEDVDISFQRTDLGFGGEQDPAAAPSKKKRTQRLDKLKEACQDMIQKQLLPQLQATFFDALRTESCSDTWQLILDSEDPDKQTLLFHYPTGIFIEEKDTPAYVRPIVRLEMGARGEHWPAEEKTILSYAAETIPKPFKTPHCSVKVLAAARTFWEKITILHACYHRQEGKSLKHRPSRHYYDVVQLYETDIGKKALEDLDLLRKVAQHQTVFFQSAWAKYDEAVPGTLHLLPPEYRKREIAQDYHKMQEMMFKDAPTLDHIYSVLAEIEEIINSQD